LIHYRLGLAIGTLLGFLVGTLQPLLIVDALHAWLARILRPISPLAWVVLCQLRGQVPAAGARLCYAIGVFCGLNYFSDLFAVRNVDLVFMSLARAFGIRMGIYRQALSSDFTEPATGFSSGMRTGIGQSLDDVIALSCWALPGWARG